MTNQKKYVAYVSTYTMGDNHGITIYDVDVENGRFTLKDRVEITNSSYLTISQTVNGCIPLQTLVWNPMKF